MMKGTGLEHCNRKENQSLAEQLLIYKKKGEHGKQTRGKNI